MDRGRPLKPLEVSALLTGSLLCADGFTSSTGL